MAGHSKWANIQHRKKAQDSKRSKVFTKLIREITTAARLGGPEPDHNTRLRAVVSKAVAASMPRDTIERAIKRGAGGNEGDDFEAITYEGYGPGGVAVMVECLTDNRNRTVSEVRHAFTKCGGNLGTDGSVAYLFEKKGHIILAPGMPEDTVMEAALESGADDVVTNEDFSIEVFTTPDAFEAVKNALEQQKLELTFAEVTWLASNEVILDKDNAEKMLKLIDMLEDLDDVQHVHSNADIPEALLAEVQ